MEIKKIDTNDIPKKKYFRIGEVSGLVGVDAHVLRYWEGEFPNIKPFRGKSKQRLYRREDVQNFLNIRRLLHEEGYTIAGARKLLSRKKSEQNCENPAPQFHKKDELLPYIKKELTGILHSLRSSEKIFK